jgi:hypothetical protein
VARVGTSAADILPVRPRSAIDRGGAGATTHQSLLAHRVMAFAMSQAILLLMRRTKRDKPPCRLYNQNARSRCRCN